MNRLMLAVLCVVLFGACVKRMAPEVTIAADSGKVPPELQARIVEDTGRFCREAGREFVTRLVVLRDTPKDATLVVYLCHDEMPDGKKRGQIRVTEMLTNYGVIVYKTMLAASLGY